MVTLREASASSDSSSQNPLLSAPRTASHSRTAQSRRAIAGKGRWAWSESAERAASALRSACTHTQTAAVSVSVLIRS
eukprot:1797581-Rhodomonas_salina.1